MINTIKITGAKEHNLKNVSVDIPKNKLIAITGPSGSGKSTFAFDILQKECQRQYMESMGMVTDGMNKPHVENIVGLSPSISISQGINNKNPRSTVGTFTEILTYLRLLYAKCGKSSQSLTMAHFSFNKSEGFCEDCHGIGEVNSIDSKGLVNENLTVAEGAVYLWKGVMASHYVNVLKSVASHYQLEFNTAKPVKEFNDLERLIFYKGVKCDEFLALYPDVKTPKRVSDGYFEGILTYLKKKSAENIRKGSMNKTIEKCFVRSICPTCNGSRLNKQARTVTVAGKTIVEVSMYTLDELLTWLHSLNDVIKPEMMQIYQSLSADLLKRTTRVRDIGLGYLTLDRMVKSLSGGEAQRLRLANLLDSGLTGVLYILDEPTTGLHPNDTEKLLSTLRCLVDIGNTVIVIEHDMEFVKACDYVLDFGPHSGVEGGQIVAVGTPEEMMSASTLTGQYLRTHPDVRRQETRSTNHMLTIKGAWAHNLKGIDVNIPLNQLVTFTGVSGSGKSTLVFDVLSKAFNGQPVKAKGVGGIEGIERVIEVTQQRIGKSSRSTVATYTDTYTLIRSIYANLKEAKMRKLKPSNFSFNVKGGRCEKCQGLGTIPLDMHFLDDIEVECPDCKGKRFSEEILSVTYKGFNISEVLDMTVKQNMEVFKDNSDVYHRLEVLSEVGLDYLSLGQSTATLSGGECQRIKISKELGRTGGNKMLYLLDEPTSGLHPSDTNKLIALLKKLVQKGNSVFTIEHSLEVIAMSDWVIDLGPEGGVNGGRIVAEGTPYEIALNEGSLTGRYLLR